MNQMQKGLLFAVIQVLLVSSLGAKLLWDREVFPRGWAATRGYDPNLPIRGRYINIPLLVKADTFSPRCRVRQPFLQTLLKMWILRSKTAASLPSGEPLHRFHGERTAVARWRSSRDSLSSRRLFSPGTCGRSNAGATCRHTFLGSHASPEGTTSPNSIWHKSRQRNCSARKRVGYLSPETSPPGRKFSQERIVQQSGCDCRRRLS